MRASAASTLVNGVNNVNNDNTKASSPILVGDLWVVHAGPDEHAKLVAVNKRTGETADWRQAEGALLKIPLPGLIKWCAKGMGEFPDWGAMRGSVINDSSGPSQKVCLVPTTGSVIHRSAFFV
jgi:hypothetical protein